MKLEPPSPYYNVRGHGMDTVNSRTLLACGNEIRPTRDRYVTRILSSMATSQLKTPFSNNEDSVERIEDLTRSKKKSSYGSQCRERDKVMTAKNGGSKQ
jgi:hypothetical protein